MKTQSLFLFLLLSLPSLSMIYSQVYLDSTASTEVRVTDLLARMTLEEKIGQMTQTERVQFNGNNIDNISIYHVGSILSGGGSSPGNQPIDWVNMYNSFQAKALATRLGIPLIYGIDAVHGHNNVQGAVIFPHNIGLGCTRNPALVEEIGRITALEVTATGIDWTFSPCLAVARNERWGRTYESFGEKPDLVKLMAEAAVKGYQGDSVGATDRILACAKHFAADGGTANGTDQGNALMSETELRDIHIEPYKDALAAGVGSVMASYSQLNGAFCHNNKFLLTDILKDELDFDGFIISDWEGINKARGDNFDSAVASCILAGIDMAMQPNDYINYQQSLQMLVDSGIVPMTRIDDAVRRILRIKFQMGLFEHPYASTTLLDTIGSEAHREVARQAVRESLVLLKNDGILPLPKSGSQVLLLGSRADDIGVQCGGWSISWQGGRGNTTEGTTIKEAFEEVLGNNLSYRTDFPIPTADLAVVVVGEDPYAEGAGDIPPSSNDFFLHTDDQRLIDSLEAKGIPMVVILISGRPLLINQAIQQANAVVAAWLPGTEATGIADVLFGDYAPTGKLSHSWPRNVALIPINAGDSVYNPLYPYGFGLDYASTAVEEPTASSPFQVFPNPAQDQFFVKQEENQALHLSLFDMAGRQVREATHAPAHTIRFSLQHLPQGTYFLRISSSHATVTKRIIKK